MNSLRYRYFSGWTPGNYVSWDSKINEDRHLVQHMNPSSSNKRKNGAVILEKQITEEELKDLEKVFASIDPEINDYFENMPVCIDDVEDIRIQSEKHSIDLKGPFLTYRKMKKDVDPDKLRPVILLLRKIDSLQPNRLQDQMKI